MSECTSEVACCYNRFKKCLCMIVPSLCFTETNRRILIEGYQVTHILNFITFIQYSTNGEVWGVLPSPSSGWRAEWFRRVKKTDFKFQLLAATEHTDRISNQSNDISTWWSVGGGGYDPYSEGGWKLKKKTLGFNFQFGRRYTHQISTWPVNIWKRKIHSINWQ